MTPARTAALAHDAALPMRDCLLDDAAVAARLARHLAWRGQVSIDRCTRVRTNYRLGRHLRTVHRVDVGGQVFTIAACMFSDGRGACAYERAAGGAVSIGPIRPAAYDAELDTVFATFPNDPRLEQLPRVWTVPAWLSRELPGRCRAVQLAGYAPEKSATLACMGDGGAVVAYAKVCAPGDAHLDFRACVALWRATRERSTLRAPRPIVVSWPNSTALTAPIDGSPPRIAGPGAADDCRRLGAAVATLHATAPCPDRAFNRFCDAALSEGAEIVARLRPDAADGALALVNALLKAGHPPPSPRVFVHGDLHPQNARLSLDHVTLFDFDDAASGEAEADVASLLASFRYLAASHQLSASASRDMAAAFVAGYRLVRPLGDEAVLRWYVAAAMLVERVLRAVTRLAPTGLQYLNEVIADARRVLAGETGALS